VSEGDCLLAPEFEPAAFRGRGPGVADSSRRVDHASSIVVVVLAVDFLALDLGTSLAVSGAALQRALLVDLTAGKEPSLNMRSEISNICVAPGLSASRSGERSRSNELTAVDHVGRGKDETEDRQNGDNDQDDDEVFVPGVKVSNRRGVQTPKSRDPHSQTLARDVPLPFANVDE
jgi:hypothetical protein